MHEWRIWITLAAKYSTAMTPLSVSCALFYIRHRYFHSGTETVQDDDPLLFSTLTVFLKLFKFSENTSLAKWNVSVLVISVHLCVSSMWIWNVGTIHLSNHSIVFLGINYITVILIILQFEMWFFLWMMSYLCFFAARTQLYSTLCIRFTPG